MIDSSGFLGQWVRRRRGEISPCCWEKLLLYTRMSFLIPKYSELSGTSGPEAECSQALLMERKVLIPETDGVHRLFTVSIFFPVKSHLEHSFGVLKYWFCLFSQNLTRKGFQCCKKPEKWNIPLRFLSKSLCSYCHPFGENLHERVKFSARTCHLPNEI